jgi:hypothetical protein
MSGILSLEGNIAVNVSNNTQYESQVQEVNEGYILGYNHSLSVLPKVFSYFDLKNEMSAIVLTCKVWHDIMVPEGCEPQLERKESLKMPEFVICQKRMGAEFSDFDCIFKHCKNLSEFHLSNYDYIYKNVTLCGQISRRWHNTEYLFARESVTQSIIESSGKHCPKLKTFYFTGMNSQLSPVSAETLSCLDRTFPNGIHLKDFPLFLALQRDESLSPIQSFKNLTSLDHSSLGTTGDEIFFIAEHFPNLRELDAKQGEEPITDRSIVDLAKNCPLLTHLCIPGSEITAVSLRALAKYCKDLKFFFHAGCHEVTSEDVSDLKRELPNLVATTSFEDRYTQMSREKVISRMDAANRLRAEPKGAFELQ